jgi:hypothetical protein
MDAYYIIRTNAVKLRVSQHGCVVTVLTGYLRNAVPWGRCKAQRTHKSQVRFLCMAWVFVCLWDIHHFLSRRHNNCLSFHRVKPLICVWCHWIWKVVKFCDLNHYRDVWQLSGGIVCAASNKERTALHICRCCSSRYCCCCCSLVSCGCETHCIIENLSVVQPS